MARVRLERENMARKIDDYSIHRYVIGDDIFLCLKYNVNISHIRRSMSVI